MKRSLKIFLLVVGILVLLCLLLVASCFVFEDRLLNQGKNILSKNLGTEIEAEKMDINPLGHFPYITLTLGDLSIDGSNESTMLRTSNVELLINPLSVFQDELALESLNLSKGQIDLIKNGNKWNFDFGSNNENGNKGIKLSNVLFEDIVLKYKNHEDSTTADVLIQHFDGAINLGETFGVSGDLKLIPKAIRMPDNFVEMKSSLDLDINIFSEEVSPTDNSQVALGEIDIDGEFLELEIELEKENIKCQGSVEAEFLEVFNLGFEFKDGSIDFDNLSILRAGKNQELEGALKLRNVDFAYGDQEMTVNTKALKFKKDKFLTEDLRIELGDSEFDFKGELERNDNIYFLNGELSSRLINCNDLLSIMQDSSEGSAILEGELDLDIDKIEYGKWIAKKIKGQTKLTKEKLKYKLDMNTFRGNLESEGNIFYADQVQFYSKASFFEIETEEILDQLDNLGQSLITSDNLSGELSGHALLDFYLNQDNSLDEDKSNAKIALDVQKGKLTDFKMLEDFSKHIDVDDLMNVKFDHLSNLLEWKGNHLALPLVFINNNAANFTISGHHDKDNNYTYNLQVNASDILARKFGKKKSSSRRKGWWNMYYVIEGRGEEVKTESDKERVKTNFRRSKEQKRKIFKELLSEFGNTEILQNINDWTLSPDQ